MKIECCKISNGGLTGERLPDRLQVFKWGENPNVKAPPVIISKRTVESMASLQRAKGFGTVALDYEHNTVEGSPEFCRTQEPRKVGGYGVPVAVEGEGVFLERMAYTPSGTENAREYIDLSPAFVRDPQTNELLFLHSVALCRQGAVEDLTFFNVSMDITKGTEMEELKKQLDALSAAVAELKQRFDAMAQPAEAMTALHAKVGEIEGSLATMKTDFQTEIDRMQKESIAFAAAAAGKVVDPAVVMKLSVSELKAHVETLAVTVPVGRRTVVSGREAAGPGASLIEQYNAIQDPAKRAEFFQANREKLFGKN